MSVPLFSPPFLTYCIAFIHCTMFFRFMMTRSFPYCVGVERHPSSRQPVNQALNTLEIRGDYHCSKSSVTETWPGSVSQSVRMDGWIDAVCYCDDYLRRRGSLTISSFSFKHNLCSIASGTQIRYI